MNNVLITGSSKGFGKLITRTLLNDGLTVAASMRDPQGRNAEAAKELKKAGAHIVDIDVTGDASVGSGVEAAMKALGGIDILINNAGVGVLGYQEAFDIEDWKKVFDINVFGVQRMNRAVIPHMRDKRSGLLIHISSLLGRVVIPFYGPYNATKHALEAMADNYRIELSAWGVESVLIEPGGYGTDFAAALLRPSDAERTASYGAYAQAPEQSFEAFAKVFEGKDAPDPQWVADAVSDVIKQPRGERPFRTAVDRIGMGDAVEPYNRMYDDMQRGMYQAFGMEGVLELQTEK